MTAIEEAGKEEVSEEDTDIILKLKKNSGTLVD